jgi:hypothetical protein
VKMRAPGDYHPGGAAYPKSITFPTDAKLMN